MQGTDSRTHMSHSRQDCVIGNDIPKNMIMKSRQYSTKGDIRTRSGGTSCRPERLGLTYNKHKHGLPGLIPPHAILREKREKKLGERKRYKQLRLRIPNNKKDTCKSRHKMNQIGQTKICRKTTLILMYTA